MKIFMLVSILFLAATAFGQGKELVGYKYDGVIPGSTLPNGWKSEGGALIGDFTKDPIRSLERVSKAGTQMIWLERAVSKDARGSVQEWEVIDTLTFANFPADHDLLYGGGPMPCTEKGKPAEDLVVQVQFLKKTETYRTIKAWRANLEDEKFVPVDARTVKCIFESP